MSARGTHPTNELTAASAQDSTPESRFNLSKDTQAAFNSLELYRGFSDLPKHSDQGSATLPRVDVMDTGNSLKREPIILAQAQERGSSRDFQGDRPSQTKPEGEAPARAWEMNSTPSICNGCSKGCNTYVWIRDNKVIRHTPKENLSINQYWMCDDGMMTYKRASE
ncbi:MAG TPA: hypothetical protein PKH78_09435, partial [Candidatus Obscuribacter sp.]|nr:hypothetical protein [Candidatus Obscuribacter sp.]